MAVRITARSAAPRAGRSGSRCRRIGQLQVAGPLAIGVSADCQFRLQFTRILEVGQLLPVLVPAGLKVSRLPSNMPWNSPMTVPLLRITSQSAWDRHRLPRTRGLRGTHGGGQILHRQADRERTKLHGPAPQRDAAIVVNAGEGDKQRSMTRREDNVNLDLRRFMRRFFFSALSIDRGSHADRTRYRPDQHDIVGLGLIAATLALIFWAASGPTPLLKKIFAWVPHCCCATSSPPSTTPPVSSMATTPRCTTRSRARRAAARCAGPADTVDRPERRHQARPKAADRVLRRYRRHHARRHRLVPADEADPSGNGGR